MSKYIFIAIFIVGGLAICVFAPLGWRLIGAFCAGGGCYAICESLKLMRIQREIARYEQPVEKAQPRRRRAIVRAKNRFGVSRSRNTLPDAAG